MKLMPLPAGFGWAMAGKRYFKQVRRAVEEGPELRERQNAVTLQQVLEAIDRSAPPDDGFQNDLYRTRIRERYGYSKFDSFQVTGADVRRIALRQVFAAPDAKEELLRMAEVGEMDARELQAARPRGILAEVSGVADAWGERVVVGGAARRHDWRPGVR